MILKAIAKITSTNVNETPAITNEITNTNDTESFSEITNEITSTNNTENHSEIISTKNTGEIISTNNTENYDKSHKNYKNLHTLKATNSY